MHHHETSASGGEQEPCGPTGEDRSAGQAGDRTLIAFGWPIDWLDDRTLLIRARRFGEG